MKTRESFRLVSIIFYLLLFFVINQSLSYADVETVGYWELKAEQCRAVDVSGNIAYFGMLDTLVIADFSDPSNPVVLSKILLSFIRIYDIAVSGIYVYAVTGSYGLHIIDVSDPSAPFEVGYWNNGTYSYGVAVSGNYAYIADRLIGLRVIDVTDPTLPEEVGSCDTDDQAMDIAVSGHYVYVADRSGGLRIIDVTDPSNPWETSSFLTWTRALGVAVSGNYAYVADRWDGLFVIDVFDPESPELMGVRMPEPISDFNIQLRESLYPEIMHTSLVVLKV